MAKDKKKKKSDDAEDESEGGGKLKLIIGAIVLLAAGVALGTQVLGGSGATAEAMGPTTTTTEPPGMITTIDSITLNLADGRFLKLGLSFEVHHDEEYPDPEQALDATTKGFARELDAVITLMGSYSYSDLVAPGGKVAAKQQIMAEVERTSDGAIRDVLFHEFVMQ